MSEEKIVPKLRLKNFTSAWNQKELKNVAVVKDGTHDSPKYVATGFPLITSKNLTNGKINFQDISYISSSDFDNINKRSKVENGDILFAMIGTIGNPVIIKESNFAIKNVALIKKSPYINNIFLKQIIDSDIFKRYVQKVHSGNTQKFISLNQIRSFKFYQPTILEQNKIAKVFVKIQNIISLQQRKLDLLKKVKKGFLQKLFPENGTSVPNIRFQGFADDWKQRKLGDITKIIAGGDKNKAKIKTKGEYPVIANSINTDGIIGYYDDQYRITAPAITVTGRGDIGHARARFTNFTPVVRLLALTTKHNVIFLSNAINRTRIYNESTGVPQLTKPQLANYKVSVTNKKEENNIASLLGKLQSCIVLQQQKVDQFIKFKKFLLQNMFI